MRLNFSPISDEVLIAWREGVEQFNQGRYWHAHESWEKGWVALPELERTYVQALIQVAAVFHLLEIGRLSPAFRLAGSALEKLERSSGISRVLPRLEIENAERVLIQLTDDSTRALSLRSHLKAVLLLPSAV